MSLSPARKKHFRTIGHELQPVVTVAAKGLSESVLAEIDRALTDHELIKIKLAVGDRDAKKRAIETISSELDAEVVQTIGHIALLFRAAEQPNPKLSNLPGPPVGGCRRLGRSRCVPGKSPARPAPTGTSSAANRIVSPRLLLRNAG